MKRNTNSATRTTSTKSSTPPKKRGRPAKKIVLKQEKDTGWVNTTDLIKDHVLEAKTNLIEQMRQMIANQENEILKLKVAVLDQAAIINYLEKKVDKLKGELANG